MPWKLDGQPDDNNLMVRDYQIGQLQNVHYIEGGKRDGLPVILLHENLASSRWWEAAQEQMPYRYRTLALDFRGYGLSEYKPIDSVKTLAQDVADFADALGLKKFSLVGWGMGGGVAMQYAVLNPGRLASLILVNSISPKGHRPPERAEQLDEMSRALRSGNRAEIATYLRRNFFRAGNFPVGEPVEGELSGKGINANEAAFNYILAGSMQAQNYAYGEQEGIFKVLRSFNLADELAKLNLPVYAITSNDTRLIRAEEQREIRQLFANSKMPFDEAYLPGTGHSPMVERSDEFMQALTGFLGRVAPIKG